MADAELTGSEPKPRLILPDPHRPIQTLSWKLPRLCGTLFADWMMFIVFCCFLPFHWQAASADKHSISQAPAFGDLRLPSGIDVAEFAWLVLAGHLQKPKHSKQRLVYRASIIEYPNVSQLNIFKQIQIRKKLIKFASLSGLVPASHGDLA